MVRQSWKYNYNNNNNNKHLLMTKKLSAEKKRDQETKISKIRQNEVKDQKEYGKILHKFSASQEKVTHHS